MAILTSMENIWESYCSPILTCVTTNRAAVTWRGVGVMLLTSRSRWLHSDVLKGERCVLWR